MVFPLVVPVILFALFVGRDVLETRHQKRKKTHK